MDVFVALAATAAGYWGDKLPLFRAGLDLVPRRLR
jgi:hypothetical protein